MKSCNHLYEKYLSDENYYIAVHNATLNKSSQSRRRKAKWLKEHMEQEKDRLMYYAEHFYNAKHKPKEIYDGIVRKKRTILVPTQDEEVIHHMICNVLKPIFMKSMYEHNYGSVPNRGVHKAKKQVEKWIKHDAKNCKYILKLDIRHYFPSIPHSIIKDKLRKLIHDKKFCDLVCAVIDANDEGLPLGFYTSQWLANWYLQDLDHYIKEVLKASHYVRYMDDMVIFGSNKKKLHKMRILISQYLNQRLGLELKNNWQVFRFDYVKGNKHYGRDLDFMGFRFFRNKTILRKKMLYKASRKARKMRKKQYITEYDCRQMLSYLGWIDDTNTYNAYTHFIKPFISFKFCKRRISKYDKTRKVV